MFLKKPVFCRLEIRLATASLLSAVPSMATLAPWSCMLFNQTASVPLTVSPIIESRLTGPVWLLRNWSMTSTRRL